MSINPRIPNFHHAAASLIQSAIKHVIAHGGRHKAGLAEGHAAMEPTAEALQMLVDGETGAGRGQTGSIPEDCVRLLVEYAWAVILGNKKREKEIEDEYTDSDCDVRWLKAVVAYVLFYDIERRSPRYISIQQHPKVRYDLPRGKDLVIGVLGDWGTGTPVARVVANQLFEHFDPDLVIHVGDTYYAGTLEEQQLNLLDVVRDARRLQGKDTPFFNLPGNHDYYAGGQAFYDILPLTNDAPYQQQASFWALSNENWQLQGMDTGFFDHNLFHVGDDITHLHGSEAVWHQQQIDAAHAAGRKVILFSHHQLFSALLNIGKDARPDEDNFNPYLWQDFGSRIEAGKVLAWFWGHEHLLEVYQEHRSLRYGRCIGHSAFPEIAPEEGYNIRFPKVPLDTSVELGTSSVAGVKEYNHGFEVLTLGRDGTARADYYTVPADAVPERGNPQCYTEIFSETLD